MLNVLVTGGAGFIGSHLCDRLLGRGHRVVAIDNFDRFYDPGVKRENLAGVLANERFDLLAGDILDPACLARAAQTLGTIDAIVHLAARAGVRPSIEDPALYARVNVQGTVEVLELARRSGVQAVVFGSSSSVYGNNERVPFTETHPVDHPISPYAATKRAGELLCHTYHHLYGLSIACLRFFTVYGPRQRPDLAIYKFSQLLLAGRPIPLYGDGSTSRDYTYVDDIVDGIEAALDYCRRDRAVFEIVNLGGSSPVSLGRLVDLLAAALAVTPQIERLPAQPGDVERTYADVGKAERLWGYRPGTNIEEGLRRFARWLRQERVGVAVAEPELAHRTLHIGDWLARGWLERAAQAMPHLSDDDQ